MVLALVFQEYWRFVCLRLEELDIIFYFWLRNSGSFNVMFHKWLMYLAWSIFEVCRSSTLESLTQPKAMNHSKRMYIWIISIYVWIPTPAIFHLSLPLSMATRNVSSFFHPSPFLSRVNNINGWTCTIYSL